MPRGSAGGDDHVISPVALVPYRDDSYIVCFDISKHPLHLRQIEQRLLRRILRRSLPRLRRGGEIVEEAREVSPRGRGGERRRDGARSYDGEHRLGMAGVLELEFGTFFSLPGEEECRGFRALHLIHCPIKFHGPLKPIGYSCKGRPSNCFLGG
jgi:hypothetical protein